VLVIVLQVIAAVMFVLAGGRKVPATVAHDDFPQYGYTPGFRRIVGGLELLGAAGLIAGIWIPLLATLSGIGLAVLMVGAVVTHIRGHDPLVRAVVPAVLLVIVAVIILAR